MIKYIGKAILIECKEKILVVGDLHLGYDDEMVGDVVSGEDYRQKIEEIEEILVKTGKVDKMILLGDIKNRFSEMTENERYDLVNFFDYLERKFDEIVIIKGNHDTFLSGFVRSRKIKIVDNYIEEEYCFLHGDRDFKEIHDKEIKYWIMGHIHPAIVLREEPKAEKYKCFLIGNYKGKEIIILPSFSGVKEGIDVRNMQNESIWKFQFDKFNVKVVGENLEVLEFGKLNKIR